MATGTPAPRSYLAGMEPARFPADLAAVQAIFRDYEHAARVPACFADFERELATLPGAYAPPKGALLIARDRAGRVVGCIAMRPAEPGSAEIKRLFVKPGERGGGLGRRLTLAALAAARQAGYRRVVLETHASMTAAQRLYRALGFTEVETPSQSEIHRLALGLVRAQPKDVIETTIC